MTYIEFSHKPVLLNECIDGLDIKPDGIYVDCTIGGMGHSFEILKHLNEKGMLIGLDQDQYALDYAEQRVKELNPKAKVRLVHTNFEQVGRVIEEMGIEGADGILMDIGVSSYQLDEKDRGFSYQQDAKLDMRMNRENLIDAYHIVNEYSKKQLEEIIYGYGEERWGARIAQFIVNEREKSPIETTGRLVEIIKKAVPVKARQDGPHPAKRTFQAIRIEVNDELKVLEKGIREGFKKLNTGGRMCIITFHSLEDRIVKNEFASLVKGCTCPSDFPICICGKKQLGKLITRKPVTASEEEAKSNPRARSAKLRIIQRM